MENESECGVCGGKKTRHEYVRYGDHGAVTTWLHYCSACDFCAKLPWVTNTRGHRG